MAWNTKTYISVCKNVVLSNIKNGTNKPPIRVSRGKYGKPTHHRQFDFRGNARIMYDPSNPMPWGARVWIEV